MYVFIMVIHVIASLVLILVILMQAGRGGGVSEIFGGSSNQTIFGTSAAQFLTRATAACAVLFIITSLSLAVMSSRRSRSLLTPESGLPITVEQSPMGAADSAIPEPSEAVDVPVGEIDVDLGEPVATDEGPRQDLEPKENEKSAEENNP
ncbi:MAG: preprotein translocase subunit SecG [Candidatus Omnitrophica bacterium]|nr:preprotein translocase subunit SecG [Candidatus Omnitrophota bacterium]